jgi:hypothetical protein
MIDCLLSHNGPPFALDYGPVLSPKTDNDPPVLCWRQCLVLYHRNGGSFVFCAVVLLLLSPSLTLVCMHYLRKYYYQSIIVPLHGIHLRLIVDCIALPWLHSVDSGVVLRWWARQWSCAKQLSLLQKLLHCYCTVKIYFLPATLAATLLLASSKYQHLQYA